MAEVRGELADIEVKEDATADALIRLQCNGSHRKWEIDLHQPRQQVKAASWIPIEAMHDKGG